MTDEELLLAYRKSKDNSWLGYLLQRYTMLLLGVAIKYLKDKDEAQDAVQHVFLKTIVHLPQDHIQNFKGWLYILMRNHCLQLLREQPHKADESILSRLPAVETNKEEAEWKNYTLEQMQSALEELNEEQRRAVQLFYLEKLTYQQIMEQTGLTFTQVKSYIQNGKRNLKIILLKKLAKGDE